MIKCRNNAGFSLLELALVLFISGIVVMFGMRFLAIYTTQAKMEKTNGNITLAKSALDEFYGLTGRYPCPADPKLSPSDANYGREQCRPVVETDCVNGVPANIVCTTVGTRDADENGLPDTVLIGGFPFRDVIDNIEDTDLIESASFDAQDMQFTYAVTEQMTDNVYDLTDPANFHLGAITVLDENKIDILDPAGSAHFVLVSHGENQKGGYSQNGLRATKCLTQLVTDPPETEPSPGLNASGIAPEKENCDYNDGIFISGLRSLGKESDYYDDYMAYTSTGLRSHWSLSLGATEESIYSTNLGNVGVGVDNPDQKLHVADDISAEGGVGALSYCKDGADPDCLNPDTIAGTGVKCPPGQVAYGIENNTLLCRDLFVSAPKVSCPLTPGGDVQFLVGISNKGNIKCSPFSAGP